MVYGYVKSKIDGTEKKFENVEGLNIPEKYSYINFLPRVLNQGERPICVPCSLSAHLNWNHNVDTDGNNLRDNNIHLVDIYASRTNGGDNGMSFKDALNFLRHKGVQSDAGLMKIEKYAMVGGEKPIKQALILNGPLVGALPVYNDSKFFWEKNEGDEFLGGHAISIVGYDKNGLIIRNSWGVGFADNGYTHINWEDLNKFYEIWTIVD